MKTRMNDTIGPEPVSDATVAASGPASAPDDRLRPGSLVVVLPATDARCSPVSSRRDNATAPQASAPAAGLSGLPPAPSHDHNISGTTETASADAATITGAAAATLLAAATGRALPISVDLPQT